MQGKRGNIARVPGCGVRFHSQQPATDSVHIQCTGFNSHNNGGGGGVDGQARDEGQGKDGRFKVIKTQEQLMIPKRNVCVLVQFTYRY